MAQAAIPLFIGSSLLSFSQQRGAGAIAKAESRTMARQAGLEATAREADRKTRLADALASQNASAGARNIAAYEGSPLAILESDIQAEERATERDMFATELEQMSIRSRGRTAKRMGQARAITGLLKTGTQLAMLGDTDG